MEGERGGKDCCVESKLDQHYVAGGKRPMAVLLLMMVVLEMGVDQREGEADGAEQWRSKKELQR